jgi:futalosine hydrolase
MTTSTSKAGPGPSILLVAATEAEIAAMRPTLGARVHALVTGVGMVATAARCARALAQRRYDFALNVGVCGSFDPSLGPGTVVHVVRDRIAELGAEDGAGFLTVADLGLPADPVFVNADPPPNAGLHGLPNVDGITVNTVHGCDESIADVIARFEPQIETMEGAGFMCACLDAGVPFAQVRAVSNVVERRNRSAWQIDQALATLTDAAARILEHA